ncbi:MAG: hypothetical protein IJ934_01245 [Acetobacter sp.]|nr:hypothetical protein [Acetobacter sp.]
MLREVPTPTPEEQEARLAEVVKLILNRNGIKLDKDDPLLIIHTLNQHLIQSLGTQQNELMRNFYHNIMENVEYAKQEWCNNAKEEANKILFKASNASTELFQVRLKDATDEMVSKLQKASTKIEKQLDTKTQNYKTLFQKSLYFLIGATAINVLTAILLIIMFL